MTRTHKSMRKASYRPSPHKVNRGQTTSISPSSTTYRPTIAEITQRANWLPEPQYLIDCSVNNKNTYSDYLKQRVVQDSDSRDEIRLAARNALLGEVENREVLLAAANYAKQMMLETEEKDDARTVDGIAGGDCFNSTEGSQAQAMHGFSGQIERAQIPQNVKGRKGREELLKGSGPISCRSWGDGRGNTNHKHSRFSSAQVEHSGNLAQRLQSKLRDDDEVL